MRPTPKRGAHRGRRSGLDRAFQVLDHLMASGGSATGYDIARALRAPTSTVYEVIDALVAKGALMRAPGSNRVSLGPRLHFYGLAYARELALPRVIADRIAALSRATGETVQVCVRDGAMMVVQMMSPGTRLFRIGSAVGTRIPLNWTASGRLLVAPLPEAERFSLHAAAVPSPTSRAETDPQALDRACLEAWSARLAVQIGVADEGVACIAAPVRDGDGLCPATISIVVPGTVAEARTAALADELWSATDAVEEAMGWRQAPTWAKETPRGSR